MPEFEKAWRRLLLYATCLILIVFGLSELSKELNPLDGHWEPERIWIDGVKQPLDWRVFLEISDGVASVAEYWTCGVRMQTFADGHIVCKRSDIALYKETSSDGELEPVPFQHLTLLKNGCIEFKGNVGVGGVTIIQFKRTENGKSIFDLVGWK